MRTIFLVLLALCLAAPVLSDCPNLSGRNCGCYGEEKTVVQIGSHIPNGFFPACFVSGMGLRVHRINVAFKRQFKKIPDVNVAFNTMDVSNKDNVRAKVTAEEISTRGFTIVYTTWWNTDVYSLGASWIAASFQ